MQSQETTTRNGRTNGYRNGYSERNGKREMRNGNAHQISNGHTSVKKSKEAKKGKLDSITFIYGFGAAIVLVGAMFKFLGWSFANELFIVGLSIEAVVFLISAFERKEEEKEYQWENVFPQLNGQGQPMNGSAGNYGEAMQLFNASMENMSSEIHNLSLSIRDIRANMEASAQSSVAMQNQMEDYIHLMGHYNANLRSINDKYDRVLES